MTHNYTALALFSGGLDSILAMKTIASLGLRVLGLHFCSPFFGHPRKIAHWQNLYGLDIEAVNIHGEFVDLLRNGPCFGYGKVLNPCVDCKILMFRTAKALLPKYDARFIISGEVLAQRPMSQRRDTLNLISKQAQVQNVLLRPLSALHLKPTPMEDEGLVDRSRLHGISGRGRKDQLRLAQEFRLTEIPTPAGGCLLAEKESAKRYWPVLTRLPEQDAQDFELARVGRQYWHGGHWLVVGRNRQDNEIIEKMAGDKDMLFKAMAAQGPLALGRQKPGAAWDDQTIRLAAAFVAGFSGKYQKPETTFRIRVTVSGQEYIIECSLDARNRTLGTWSDFTWDQTQEEKKEFMAKRGSCDGVTTGKSRLAP